MLSVIIPTREERDNIEPILRRLSAVRSALDEPMEVLVVDHGSQDGTAACAADVLSREGLDGQVIADDGPRDLIRAVLVGARAARGERIAVMDADLSHPPELLPQLLQAVRAGSRVAVASRYVAGGGVEDWPPARRMLSHAGRWLARPLVPVHDATSGYFVCEAPLLRSLAAGRGGFKILLELLVRQNVRSIREVPYVFKDRQRGTSKLSRRVMWLYMGQLGRLYGHRLGAGAASDG